MDYEEMLGEAYTQLLPEVLKRERFEVSKPVCTVFGSRTIFRDFKEICPVCERPDARVVEQDHPSSLSGA